MALREDILNPISDSKPAGDSLRYAPVFDRIKEARRQDDDAAQGDWQYERKVAEYPVVVKLASEAIATKSKDLQLAAWLTEALLHTAGYAGLQDGLELIRALVENFWDGLWPELDDGDTEMRAAPIDWVGQYLAIPAKRVAITKSGYDYLKYLEAKAVGYEPADEYDARREAYNEAVAEGKLPMEQFDKAVNSTSKEFYEQAVGSIDSCLRTMEDSQPLFEEKFGEYAPSYGRLRESIEEVRRTLRTFLQKKQEAEAPAAQPEADVEPQPEEAVADETVAGEPTEEITEEAPAPAAVVRKAPRRVTSAEPADKDDAAARVAAAAAFWRREDPYNPAPYLMLRGMRWGEIRASEALDSSLFEAPATEIRTALKRLLNEGSYAEAIDAGEAAMAEACGRAWLDLQRYVVTACDGMGYSAVSAAIKSELKLLLRDYPDLLHATLLDDTPTANKDTLSWIAEFAGGESSGASAASWSAPPPLEESEVDESPEAATVEAGPDSYQLATEAVRGGRIEEAFTILADEIARQNSGRGRFQRKLQLAQICLGTGNDGIAQSLLEELAAAIDRHQLEDWESPEVVAHALSLLYSCVSRTDMDPAAKSQLYARICRLSPLQALRHGTQALAHGR